MIQNFKNEQLTKNSTILLFFLGLLITIIDYVLPIIRYFKSSVSNHYPLSKTKRTLQSVSTTLIALDHFCRSKTFILTDNCYFRGMK
jgi:hypothetical protein